MTVDMQQLMQVSAEAAVECIFELEPRMTENDDDILTLEAVIDRRGEESDVRDIVIKRDSINWEIGLSIKHNHEAGKHSRLSSEIDFGYKWYGIPCSQHYWNDVTPVFLELKRAREKGIKWSDLNDKNNDVYIPILQAFIREINRAYIACPSLPQRLLEYVIGREDYYKIISKDSRRLTLIKTFNVHGDLNKKSKKKISSISVPIVDLPTELIAIKFKRNSSNTVVMWLDNGWQLSFRLHNASTIVQPSLKFDIQFIGMPTSVLTFECRWHY